MNMELSDLLFFRTVVEAGGVTRAAAQLHCVPSNVSTRIRLLEERLDAGLFIRRNRRLLLTAPGRQLLDYARRILTLAAEAEATLRDTEPQGAFAFGSLECTAGTQLPGPLAEFHRENPRVQVELRIGTTAALVEQVLSGALEAAIVGDAPAHPELAAESLGDEEIVLVAEAGHAPITQARQVAARSLLAFARGCSMRARAEQWFENGKVQPARTAELPSYHAILGGVVAGMGVAVMSRRLVEAFIDQTALSIHPLPARLAMVPAAIVWRRGEQSPRLRAFLEIL